jgi:very-short-patch-repair endonuclease
MEFAKRNGKRIKELYADGHSSYQIAEELDTYSTKILRALTYLGVEKRDYKEAQIMAIENGRAEHPTEGKTLSEEHKRKIGIERAKAWDRMTDLEREKVSKTSKDNWDKMSQEQKDNLSSLAMEAVRRASKEGSKTERHLKNKLEEIGVRVEFHKNVIASSKLEIDLFLPELKTAIEIDGPGHFLPIWGEEKLQKQKNSDIIKQGILLKTGYAVLRIRQVDKSISLTKMNMLLDIVVEEINKIKKKFPKSGQRLIEIEVKDGRTRRI